MIEAVLITLACLAGWVIAAVIVVPIVLVLEYGSIDLRSKDELIDGAKKAGRRSHPYRRSSYETEEGYVWEDARDVARNTVQNCSPLTAAVISGLLSPLIIPLIIAILPLALGVTAAGAIIRWEGDLVNHRLTLRRKVKAALNADKENFEKLVDDARKELDAQDRKGNHEVALAELEWHNRRLKKQLAEQLPKHEDGE